MPGHAQPQYGEPAGKTVVLIGLMRLRKRSTCAQKKFRECCRRASLSNTCAIDETAAVQSFLHFLPGGSRGHRSGDTEQKRLDYATQTDWRTQEDPEIEFSIPESVDQARFARIHNRGGEQR
jgi:hypothetical protein